MGGGNAGQPSVTSAAPPVYLLARLITIALPSALECGKAHRVASVCGATVEAWGE
jgi:hypothetical protein